MTREISKERMINSICHWCFCNEKNAEKILDDVVEINGIWYHAYYEPTEDRLIVMEDSGNGWEITHSIMMM